MSHCAHLFSFAPLHHSLCQLFFCTHLITSWFLKLKMLPNSNIFYSFQEVTASIHFSFSQCIFYFLFLFSALLHYYKNSWGVGENAQEPGKKLKNFSVNVSGPRRVTTRAPPTKRFIFSVAYRNGKNLLKKLQERTSRS